MSNAQSNLNFQKTRKTKDLVIGIWDLVIGAL